MEVFASAARGFRAWVDAFDPATCSVADVVTALEQLLDKAPRDRLEDESPPVSRIYKPNTIWQDVQRRVAALPFNGYRTRLVPNSDATADTQCALSYDLADIHEQLAFLDLQERRDDFATYLDYVSWGYTNLRIRAATTALRACAVVSDPFERLYIKGRAVRFVTWRTSSSTHVSEDAEDIRGASTLCGGRRAFHKHTQQQWSCYACEQCRCIVNGVEYTPWFPAITLSLREAP